MDCVLIMEENNRINRRSRPRPYDLRRKVLLKNFLREQMTYIPETRVDLLSQNNDDSITESSDSSSLDDLPELKDEDESSSASVVAYDDQNNTDLSVISTDLSDPLQLDSKDDSASEMNNPAIDNNLTFEPVVESGVFKFTRLMKFKRESKKTLKGIFKAKEVCKNVKTPVRTRSFKSGIERVFSIRKRSNETSSQIPRSKPKSPFSLFKYRRQQLKNVAKIKRSTCIDLSQISDSKQNTTNQSVQTDDSWAREQMKAEQSNKRLREENRLLAESLSYLISNPSLESQIKNCSSPLQSSNKDNSLVYPDYYVPSSNSGNNNWNPRSRVSRSRSVHEYNESRHVLRNNYRTRSMNYHNYRNNFSATSNRANYPGINNPRERRSGVTNMPVSSSVRSIQRRSSMPERILSENDRTMVCRRSGSVRDTRSRKPFHALPSEAFY